MTKSTIAPTLKQQKRAANVAAINAAVKVGAIKVKKAPKRIHRNPNPKTSRKAKPL
jgi:hypothetical protein